MSFCDLSTREEIFVGANNVIKLIPLSNVLTNTVLDMTGVTLVEVCVGAVDDDSSGVSPPITWAEEAISGVDTWVISIQAGLFPSLALGEQNMRVTVTSSDYPDGLVVAHDIPVNVIAAC